MKIAFVSCVKTKRQTTVPIPAKELYHSPLFTYAFNYCTSHYDKVYILSACYGLLDPLQTIVYYEQTLNNMGKKERLDWAEKVLLQLKRTEIKDSDELFFYCGIPYRENLIKALPNKVHVPLEGVSFGNQLAYYKKQKTSTQSNLFI